MGSPAAAPPIPRKLWQTTHLDASIVPDLLGSHANGFERRVFRDAECEAFMLTHFPECLPSFRRLQGAHRADLWRYCVLYVHGGVYLDIKTVLRAPLDALFPSRTDKFTWYAVVCNSGTCIYNGIIATPPRNPVLLRLIDYICDHSPPSYYLEYVDDMKRAVEASFGAAATAGVLETGTARLVLRQEVCSFAECARTVKGRLDRYGTCCNVYAPELDPTTPAITVRDPDYPWDRVPARHYRFFTLTLLLLAVAVAGRCLYLRKLRGVIGAADATSLP